jgi:hypothetical protein
VVGLVRAVNGDAEVVAIMSAQKKKEKRENEIQKNRSELTSGP